MNKICTSYEQSQSLLALGLDPNTADMKYDPRWDIPVIISEDDYDNHLNYDPESENTDIPAWSLSALLKLMPTVIYKNKTFGKFQKEIEYIFDLVKDTDEGNDFFIALYSEVGKCVNDDTILINYESSTPLDAAFEMICWLLENKKICV